MARDILSEYGSDVPHPQASKASDGGQQIPKSLPYSPPRGPSNINDPKSPGLHGENYGNAPCQGKH